MKRFENSAKDREWEKFREAWPFVSEDLMARRREVDRLFDPGALWYHSGVDPEMAQTQHSCHQPQTGASFFRSWGERRKEGR